MEKKLVNNFTTDEHNEIQVFINTLASWSVSGGHQTLANNSWKSSKKNKKQFNYKGK